MGKNSRRVEAMMMDEGEHREYLSRLRCALIDDNRKDRDVTADVKPFMSYKRNGLNLDIQFATKLSPSSLAKWALETTKDNMQEIYDESGYMWDDDDKREELMEHGGAARFLVAREASEEAGKIGRPVAFVHFRFSLQGEAVGCLGGQPCLYIMDIQIEKASQRKGLGRHLVRTLEMIARKQKMMHVMLPVTSADSGAKAFFLEGMKGFELDDLSKVQSRDRQDPAKLLREDGTFVVISKSLDAPKPAAATIEAAPATPQKSKSGPAPSDGDLSAANTPAKDDVKSASDSAAAAPVPAFDPTFGAPVPAAAAADASQTSAASRLLSELRSIGAVPDDFGPDAERMLIELMDLFKQKNGREPNEAEVEKWVMSLKGAADLGLVAEEDGEEEEESDEGSDSEEESEEEEEAD